MEAQTHDPVPDRFRAQLPELEFEQLGELSAIPPPRPGSAERSELFRGLELGLGFADLSADPYLATATTATATATTATSTTISEITTTTITTTVTTTTTTASSEPVVSTVVPPPATSSAAAPGTFLLVEDASSTNNRDSFSSIVDDPFFLRYSSAITTGSLAIPGQRNDSQQFWPPPRKESLSTGSPTPWFESSRSTMENINIAIIGADGVGKSSFIQQALRFLRPPSLNVTAIRLDIDAVPYLVTLVELDLEVFDVDPDQPIQWPKQIGGHMIPRMDGALILYDVMNKESIRDLSPTMAALSNSSLPTVLVATKCDQPEDIRQLDPAGVASEFPASTGHYKTSTQIPGSSREALQAMLRAAVASRKEKSEGGGPNRRRAASTANLDAPPDLVNGRPISQHSKHSRASSDFSLLRGFQSPPNEGPYVGRLSRSPRLEYQIHAHYTGSNLNSDVPEDGPPHTLSSMLRTPGIRLDGPESFLDIEESDAESYRYSDDVPILQRNDEGFLERPPKVAGVTFSELVDRLVAPKMTRADSNFADVFLCLYRKFAAPGELFAAILERLDRVRNDTTTPYLIKIGVEMRIVEVVAKWVSLYPGDFARPVTKRKLEELIRQLSTDPVFSAGAQQMRAHLEHRVVEDDDTRWAKSDDTEEGTGPGGNDSKDSGAAPDWRPGDFGEAMSSLHLEEPGGSADLRRASHSSEHSAPAPSNSQHTSGIGMGFGGSMSSSTGSVLARFQHHSYEDYEREAATLVPQPTLPLNKFRYHLFMEMDPDDMAVEMTRIDWIMFSSIRIRDMVRHVSLPAEEKEKCRSLKNMDRMVAHFNHVAKWVANMILIRDKAKHRAPCLERFMVLAQKLRQMNNYNGLAAVLAGINGTAIHRLAQTRTLVNPDVQKRFARLVLLMGTQKSHFAYRLAWENSPLPRIPFMPLHRRDLVSAEEGSRTFVGPQGDRINWKKFEVLGEVLLPIMRSQGQPYPGLVRHEVSRELLLDVRLVTDDEDLYQRSTAVEPMTGGMGDSSKKKFPWLPKGG